VPYLGEEREGEWALADLAAMPKADSKRVRAALQQVADDHPQRMPFVTEMVGMPTYWRLRKGGWRAIYYMTDGKMTVTTVQKRGDVYR
jgi:mRNA-degrading endonuclease RelE of RelBE toxin-antitoxin system